jgi:hypothetical protein
MVKYPSPVISSGFSPQHLAMTVSSTLLAAPSCRPPLVTCSAVNTALPSCSLCQIFSFYWGVEMRNRLVYLVDYLLTGVGEEKKLKRQCH